MRTVRTTKTRGWAFLVLGLAALGVLALPAEAARPPVGRTYYTTTIGLETGYDLKSQCFEFLEDKLCSLDGMVCGSWRPTDGFKREMGLSFDLTAVADGEILSLEGLGRIDTRGPKSSFAGTGRFMAADGGGSPVNFSFAAREIGKAECVRLLEDSPSAGEGDVVVGSGVQASEDREVSGFDGLLASGVGMIEIRHGVTESLRITADDNLLPILTSEVRNGRLVLGADARFSTDNNIRYEITVRDFDELILAGVFGVDITGLDTDRFVVNLSGVSSVVAAGRAGHQEVHIAGVSRYDARDVTSRTVAIDIAGPSSAVVRVSETLAGSVFGGATLEYIGNPTVNVSKDLVSTLRKIG